ncbi:MAG: GNAT family N-acetyltransferase [Acidimicrobiales bacterium]
MHPHWPFFDLVVRTPRLELRYPDDELVVDVVALAARGIHDPATMPFSEPWTDEPSPHLERNSCRFFWRTRADLTPDDWHLPLAVLVDGQPVGVQGIMAKSFPVRRVVSTGSWLGQAHQRRGLGKEMRAAVLHLGFAGLDAQVAQSEAWHDNEASLAVTRALGYGPNGGRIDVRRGAPTRMLSFELDRAAWETRRRDDIHLEGLEPCLPLLGVASS